MRQQKKNRMIMRSIYLSGLLVFIFISTVSFSFKHYSKSEPDNKLKEIESKMADVRGIVDLANLRQYNIQKVIGIINFFNKNMPAEKKNVVANEIHEMCLKYTNLNVDLICATITHESARTWRFDVVSPVGALGLMQIMPETGEELATEEGVLWTTPEKVLFNPINNIRLGCRYLSTLIQQYEVDGGLAAYNGGERRAKLWLEKRKNDSDLTLLWEETRVYVPSILKLYAEYQTQTGVL
jgi:hypothetical protein